MGLYFFSCSQQETGKRSANRKAETGEGDIRIVGLPSTMPHSQTSILGEPFNAFSRVCASSEIPRLVFKVIPTMTDLHTQKLTITTGKKKKQGFVLAINRAACKL